MSNSELNELEEKVLTLRLKKGLSFNEVSKELGISEYKARKIEEKLKQIGKYTNEDITKAKIKNKVTPKTEQGLSNSEKEYKKMCIDIMSRKYFDYNRTHKFNPLVVKKLQELHSDSISYEIIFLTIKNQEKNLKYAEKKDFSSDFQKINYFSTIIKNNLEKNKLVADKHKRIQEGMLKSKKENLVNELNKNRITTRIQKTDMSDLLD